MSSIQGKREKDGKRGEIYRRRFFFGSTYWFFIKNRSFARRREGMRCFRLSSLCHKICCCYRSASFLNQYSTTTRDFLFLTFTFEINGFISFLQHAAELLNETWKKISLRVFRPERVLLWIHKREKTFRHYFSLCTLWSFMTVSYSLTAQRQSFTWKTHQILNIPFDSILIELIVELIIK